MDNLLGSLFGGGGDNDDRSTRARDFVNRYEQGPIDQGYDDNEAYEHFNQVSGQLDDDRFQRAAEQTFSRMSPQERQEFARMLEQQSGGRMQGGMSHDPRQMAGMVSQMHRQSPGGLSSLFGGGGGNSGGGGMLGGLLGGGGGFPGGNLGKVVMGGIAAYAMKDILGGGGDDDKKRRRSV